MNTIESPINVLELISDVPETMITPLQKSLLTTIVGKLPVERVQGFILEQHLVSKEILVDYAVRFNTLDLGTYLRGTKSSSVLICVKAIQPNLDAKVWFEYDLTTASIEPNIFFDCSLIENIPVFFEKLFFMLRVSAPTARTRIKSIVESGAKIVSFSYMGTRKVPEFKLVVNTDIKTGSELFSQVNNNMGILEPFAVKHQLQFSFDLLNPKTVGVEFMGQRNDIYFLGQSLIDILYSLKDQKIFEGQAYSDRLDFITSWVGAKEEKYNRVCHVKISCTDDGINNAKAYLSSSINATH